MPFQSADFPITLSAVLEPYVPSHGSNLVQGAKSLATLREAQVTEHQTVLVQQEPLIGPLLDVLAEACGAAEAAGSDAALYTPHLRVQIQYTRTYLMLGWREGRCAPWRVSDLVNWYNYKVHAALITRSEIEPYWLLLGTPICKSYMGKEGNFDEGGTLTCGSCIRRMTVVFPGAYTMIEPPGSPS